MIKKIDLLRRAAADLAQIQPNLDNTSDEVFLDIAAYHLQQLVEKTLKYYMAQHNIEFKKTHDFLVLCNQLDECGIEYPSWIYDNAETLTKYAEKTRNGEDLVGNRRKIKELLILATDFLRELQQQQHNL